MEMRDVGTGVFHWRVKTVDYSSEVVPPTAFPDDCPLNLGSVEVDPLSTDLLPMEDQGWLAWFMIAAVTGMPITIYGDGKQWVE